MLSNVLVQLLVTKPFEAGETEVLVFNINSSGSCGPGHLTVTGKDDSFYTETTTGSISFSKSIVHTTLSSKLYAYAVSLSTLRPLNEMSTKRIRLTGSATAAFSTLSTAEVPYEGTVEKSIHSSRFQPTVTVVTAIPMTTASIAGTTASSKSVGQYDDKRLFNSATETAIISSFACLAALLLVVVGYLFYQQWSKNGKFIKSRHCVGI